METNIVDVNGRKYFRPPQTEKNAPSSCTVDSTCSRQDRYTVDEIREWLAWWQEKACGFVSVRTDIADPYNGIGAWRNRKGENKALSVTESE
jgi:hypothetical protein